LPVTTNKREQRLLRRLGWEWDSKPLPWNLTESRWIDPLGNRRTDKEAKEAVQKIVS
jgi:hypothetical protein